MPDWLIQGKDWFLGPVDLALWILFCGLVLSPAIWLCLKVRDLYRRRGGHGRDSAAP